MDKEEIMNTDFSRYQVKAKEIMFQDPTPEEYAEIKKLRNESSAGGLIFLSVFTAVLLGILIFYQAIIYAYLLCLIPALMMIPEIINLFRNDFGICYGQAVGKSKSHSDSSKNTWYVSVWLPHSKQYCKSIPFHSHNSGDFPYLQPGDPVIVYKTNKKIFAMISKENSTKLFGKF